MTGTPTSNPAQIAAQSYNVIDLEKSSGTNGYYSKYNTSSSQSFMGTVGQSILGGASRALPEGFKTDVQVLSDFRLGTFLRRKGVVSGDAGSLIDGVIDFMRADKSSAGKLSVPKFNYTTKFIPIVLKTEFLLSKRPTVGRDNFYIVFDSTPDKISFSKSATWSQKEVYGRPEPIQIYASSGAVTFTLTGMFFSDSEGDHEKKIELENKLFALVTPSKNHFMPSPVEVRIGEWKRLRCIVNSVNIDASGPWRVTSAPEVDKAFDKANQTDFTARGRSLPSHSPYMYEVTFSFTVVSELNNVQYAEDIMDAGFNGGYTSKETSSANLLNADTGQSTKYRNSSVTLGDNGTSLVYAIAGSAGDVGTLIDKSATFANTTEYLKQLGLPTDANNATKTAALAQISSGLTSIVQGSITRNYGAQITKIFGK